MVTYMKRSVSMKIFEKLSKTVLTSFLIMSLVGMAVPCSVYADTMYVSPEDPSKINVRSAPDDGDVIGSLAYGEEVEVLGEEEGWYLIQLDSDTQGFVRADLLSDTKPSDADRATDQASGEGAGTLSEGESNQTTGVSEKTSDDASDGDASDGDTESENIPEIVFEQNGHKITLKNPSDASDVPSGYVLSALTELDPEGKISVFQKASAFGAASSDSVDESSIYYVYAADENGDEGWYIYDASVGGFVHTSFEDEDDDTGVLEETSPSADTIDKDTYKQMKKHYLIIVCVLVVICVLLALVSVNTLVFQRRQEDVFDEDDEDTKDEPYPESREKKKRNKKQNDHDYESFKKSIDESERLKEDEPQKGVEVSEDDDFDMIDLN